MTFRFGKRPAVVPAGTPRLGASLLPEWTPPVAVNWSKRVSQWGMLKNDTLSDCVPAAALHLRQVWMANAWGSSWTPSDVEAEAVYARWAGWNGDPSTDRGTVMSEALSDWASSGLLLDGVEDVPWVAHVDPAEQSVVKTVIAEMGGIMGGLMLPFGADGTMWLDWTTLPPAGWTVAQDGHCITSCTYDAEGLSAITWGGKKPISWEFWRAFADESWLVCARTDWLDARDDRSPGGLDWTQLEADARKLGAV